MVVVNLYGGPGSGKSSGAMYVTSLLKTKGVDAEFVSEFAKDKVWEHNNEIFKPENQIYIFGKQFFKMNRVKDKVDVIVTDSPLLLCICYNKTPLLGHSFNQVVMNYYKSFGLNMDYFIKRTKAYNPNGRLQTEKESDEISKEIKKILTINGIDYDIVGGDIEGYNKIYADILTQLGRGYG